MKRLEHEYCLRELELGRVLPGIDHSTDFNVGKNISLVPPFIKKDVDKYFIVPERVASILNWPKSVWTLLLQCVLSGKAQKVYAWIPPGDSLDLR